MLSHSLRAKVQNTSTPVPTDPNFKQVSLLLHGDGTNGAQNNTFLDSSTNNFTVTRNGNTTQGTNTPFSQPAGAWSNNFDGSGDYLVTGSSITLSGDFTVEAWAYASNLIANRAVVQIGDDLNSNGPLFYISTAGKLNCYAGSAVFTGTATISANSWVHIAVVRSGTTAKSYVNGVLDSTVSFTANPTGTVKVGAEWYNGTIGGTQMLGYISNVRITTTAVYTANFTPSTTPLTAITNTSLLTCQSNYFKDNSSNNFAITRTGTPSVQPFSPFAPTAAYSTSVNGGSMYFDGTGDYLSTPNVAALRLGAGDFTVEAWIYPNYVTNTYGCPICGTYGYVSSQDRGWAFQLTAAGKLNLFTGGSSGAGVSISSTNTIVANTWTHVAAVRSGTIVTLYINGVANGTVTNTKDEDYSVVDFNIATSRADHLTPPTGDPRESFGGNISNLRVVKGTAVYTANFTPPTAPLTAITNTSLLLSGTNAGIVDNAIKNDLETVGNAQVSTSVKKYGTGSISFDGTGDYLTIPISPQYRFGTGNWTVECWINVNSLASEMTICNLDDENVGGFGEVRLPILTDGSMRLLCSTGTAWINTATTAAGLITTGTWYHIAAVRNGSTFTLYINGTSQLTYTSSSALAYSGLFSRIGCVATGGNPMNGYIDDLRVTKGVARYTANFTPPTAAFPNQ